MGIKKEINLWMYPNKEQWVLINNVLVGFFLYNKILEKRIVVYKQLKDD